MVTITSLNIIIDMNKFEGYEWAEDLTKEELYEQYIKRDLKVSEFEHLMELNGHPVMEKKETSLLGMIFSNAIYWIIGLTIMFLAASVFG